MVGWQGRIALIGAEPHLPYERPPLSKELLQAESGFDPVFIRPREYYAEQEIALHLNTPALNLDPGAREISLADGVILAYDRLLIATGARIRRLDIPGAEQDRVFYLRTLDDSRAIASLLGPGQRLAVIGGGFIGLETAASARQRRAEVTVVEFESRLMSRGVPAIASQRFLDLHRGRGVDIRLGVSAEEIRKNGANLEVVLSDGAVLTADLVVIGIGVIPDTDLAAEAGLSVDDGILVDEFCRSSIEDIYAAGDATRHRTSLLDRHLRLESWQCAQNMAIAAAKIMCGSDEPYAEIPWMWSDQYEANLQIAGAPEAWPENKDAMMWRGDPDSGAFIGFLLGKEKIEAAVALDMPRDMRFVRRIMESGAMPTPSDLVDEAVSMRDLARSLSRS